MLTRPAAYFLPSLNVNVFLYCMSIEEYTFSWFYGTGERFPVCPASGRLGLSSLISFAASWYLTQIPGPGAIHFPGPIPLYTSLMKQIMFRLFQNSRVLSTWKVRINLFKTNIKQLETLKKKGDGHLWSAVRPQPSGIFQPLRLDHGFCNMSGQGLVDQEPQCNESCGKLPISCSSNLRLECQIKGRPIT